MRDNILLQMWMLEHIRYHTYFVDFKVEWNYYIGGHKERMEGQTFPKGIEAWKWYLKELTPDKIVWNYHLFPSEEVIYMSFFWPFIVLIGVHPYAPLRVMRKFGRCQFIPWVEDMREFMYKILAQHPSSEFKNIYNLGRCKLSSPHDRVEDREKGEVD